VLADPSPAYRTLRDAGPFVEAFSSAQGVGFNDMINEAGVGTISASDSPHHHELRSVLSERLAPRALRDLPAVGSWA
jgi:cytochrome P450